MKNVILATVFTFAATSAMAEGFNFGGSAEAEYSIENETWAMKAGPNLSLYNINVTPRAYVGVDANNTISFNGVGVEAAYGVTQNLSVYGATQADADFKYADAQVGVRLDF